MKCLVQEVKPFHQQGLLSSFRKHHGSEANLLSLADFVVWSVSAVNIRHMVSGSPSVAVR